MFGEMYNKCISFLGNVIDRNDTYPVAVSQIFIVLSREDEIKKSPFGVNLTHETVCSCPCSVLTHVYVEKSHNLIVRSFEHDARWQCQYKIISMSRINTYLTFFLSVQNPDLVLLLCDPKKYARQYYIKYFILRIILLLDVDTEWINHLLNKEIGSWKTKSNCNTFRNFFCSWVTNKNKIMTNIIFTLYYKSLIISRSYLESLLKHSLFIVPHSNRRVFTRRAHHVKFGVRHEAINSIAMS